MANSSIDVDEDRDALYHLLEVESEAATLALEATEEADKRRSAAKQKADAEYRAKYEELIESLDAWLNAEKEKCDAEQKAVYGEYAKKLEELPKDTGAFCAYVDSLLIGK